MSGTIFDLLMSTFSGSIDEYGKDVVPPNALSFDRVMEGKHIVSGSRLFGLPVEILGQVVQYLSHTDLQRLALVNSDCRQLARSQQFKSVLLNYSPNSSSLLWKLFDEAIQREHDTTRNAYLGSCIRRLTIATHPAWVERRHDFNLEAQGPDVRERVAEATKAFYGGYLGLIERALSRKALPYLELLDWGDRVVIPRSLFVAMACSNIQHLRLSHVCVDEEFEILIPHGQPRDFWPLRSLHLEIIPVVAGPKGGKSLRLLNTSILRLCAPTLEVLRWEGNLLGSKDLHSFAASGDPVRFPRLRRLTINGVELLDSSILDALIGPNTSVRELDINIASSDTEKTFFANRGNIRTLQTLCCQTIEALGFLHTNTQLSKLTIWRPLSADTPIIPILSKSFKNLSSLSLVWEGVSIPDDALEQISTLSSLSQLSLSAGAQFGWRHNWFFDHGILRKHLSKLRNLRNLVISRDAYADDFDGSFDENYYGGDFVVPRSEEEHAAWESAMGSRLDSAFEMDLNDRQEVGRRRERAFFNIHSLRMAKEASEYARLMPSLSWIYLGKVPFAIEEDSEDSKDRRAVRLTDKLDDCWTFLRRMFGLPDAGD